MRELHSVTENSDKRHGRLVHINEITINVYSMYSNDCSNASPGSIGPRRVFLMSLFKDRTMPNVQDFTHATTISEQFERAGISRRSFMELCGKIAAAAPVGLALTQTTSLSAMADTVGKAKRPSVVWLHFQDCTGCSETLLRTSAPDVADVILNVISLDYHETLMAASG